MKVKWFFASVMVAALGAVSALAQSPEALRATIPFTFTVNGVTLPAGDYSIQQSANGSRILAMRGIDSRRTVLFAGSDSIQSKVSPVSSLVFLHNGDSYALADIRWAGETSGVQLKMHAESVTSASLQVPEVTIFAAR